MPVNRLRSERKARGMRLYSLAETLGVSRVYLWRLETGKIPVDAMRHGTVRQLEAIFGIPAHELLNPTP